MYQGKGYKYRSFKALDLKVKFRIEGMLVQNECYFASPSSLNDPDDCNPRVKTPAGDLRNHIIKKSRKDGPKLSNHAITKTVLDIRNNYKNRGFQKNIRR